MSRLNLPSHLRVISVLLVDHPGALFRVAGLIRRRGFNIDTVAAGPTESIGFSRMTLTVDAGRAHADQVAKQIAKLEDVVEVADITDLPRIEREMALVRLQIPPGEERLLALTLAVSLGARIVGDSGKDVVVEITGFFDDVENVIEQLEKYNITELCRSGPLAIRKN